MESLGGMGGNPEYQGYSKIQAAEYIIPHVKTVSRPIISLLGYGFRLQVTLHDEFNVGYSLQDSK